MSTHGPEDEGIQSKDIVEVSDASMHASLYADGEVLHIDGSGELDIYTTPAFKKALVSQLESHPELTRAEIDFTEIAFLDATAFGALVGMVKRLRHNAGGASEEGAYKVKLTDRGISKTFTIMGLDKLFDIQMVKTKKPKP